jgi:hypothetical protein
MAGNPNQTVSVASSQEFLKQADRARKAAAILQIQADELFDRSKNATTSGARSNNGQQQRSQALKLIAAAEEYERRAAAADPLALNKFGRLDVNKERAALNAGGKSKASGGGGAPPSAEIDFKNAPKPSEETQEQLINDVRQGARFTTSGPRTTQTFNINSFRSEILENDVLSSHSYLVTFAPFRSGFNENAPLTRFVTNKRNILILRCENVVLPTTSLLEEENIRRYGYGPVEKVPYGVQFSDVTMTWLVDKNSELIDFFNQWMNTIVMHDSPNTRMMGGIRRPGLQEYSPFEVGYKDAYTNPIVRISVYNKQNQTTTTYEMYDVFPMNIQSMNLSWADENELQRLTVTFAYTNMKVRAPRADGSLDPESFISSGRIPPGMERLERLANTSVADAAPAPGNETSRTTVGASTPNATEPVQPPPISPDLPGLPTIRDFTSP